MKEGKTTFTPLRTWTLFTFPFFAAWVVFVLNRFHFLPAPLDLEADGAKFSEGRARVHIAELARTDRVAGTAENEERASEYITVTLRSHQAVALRHGWDFELELQQASGALSFTLLHQFFTNSYANVTNIVLRMSSPVEVGERGKTSALLVSSHFDSTLGTPGAGDG